MSDPLTLAYLGDPNSPHSRRWINFFARRGHRVHWLLPSGTDIEPGLEPSIQIREFTPYGRRRLRVVSSLQGRGALRRALAAITPDVLHAHWLTGPGWQARLSGFHPYVISPWGSDLFVKPDTSLRVRLWNRVALCGADLITVNSPYMRDAVVAAGGRRDRVALVQFGVDTKRFSPGEPDRPLLDRLGVRQPYLLSIRALRPIYGHETILDAFARLDDDLQLVMTRWQADREYLARLQAQAVRLGIGGRLLFSEVMSEPTMRELARGAVASVSVPRSDGMPVTVLEAMASGCPVVACDLPPLRWLLDPPHGDLLVPPGDPNRLHDALRRILTLTAAERERLGQALRSVVVDRADHETNMLHMEGHYRSLARSSR